MKAPLQIVMRSGSRSEALEARIVECAAKLEQFHPRLTRCRVVVEETDRHRSQGRQFRVKVEAHMPGHPETIATRHQDEDVYVALRDAFDAARRQLEEHASA